MTGPRQFGVLKEQVNAYGLAGWGRKKVNETVLQAKKKYLLESPTFPLEL